MPPHGFPSGLAPPDRISEELISRQNEQFQAFLDSLWNKVSSIVGKTATNAFFHAAWRSASGQCGCLGEMTIRKEGIAIGLTRLHQDQDPLEVLQAYLTYVETLFELLVDVTGGVMAHKLMPMVDEFKSRASHDFSAKENGS